MAETKTEWLQQFSLKSELVQQPCHCTGPKDGQPLCPCQMRGVKIVDGRYVKTIDLGPAPKGATHG